MATRTLFEQEETTPPPYAEAFWEEWYAKTQCIPHLPDEEVTRKGYTTFFDELGGLYDDLALHFLETVKTTAVDPRHDGSFGLVFFILQLVVFALRAATGQTVVGRFVVRTALEAYINLGFLAHKDDPNYLDAIPELRYRSGKTDLPKEYQRRRPP
jgi:hypothetical protein